MFDYQTSKHAHFDAACRAFAIEHNLEDVAAAVTSGARAFKAHLSKCCWRELYERLGYRDMILLRQGISRARLTFEGFGSLRDSDFSKRTANRPIKKVHPIYNSSGVQMVIAPHIVHKLQQQGSL